MTLQAKFEKSVKYIQNLPKDGPVKPTQDDQLEFYKYYKQATLGDNTTTRPGMLDFVGKAKWDAWTSVKGESKEGAQQKYIDKLIQILKKDDSAEAQDFIKELEA